MTETLTLANRYTLESSIASGGMATVWRARDEVLARPVAVKILHSHLAEDAAFLARFRREALSAAKLAHPHIVSVYDTGSEVSEKDGLERHYIVMEFCAGGTLAVLARGDDRLDPARVAEIGATICDALAYAHRHELVHRDIKPQNVLLTEQDVLKVADFGIAKAAFAKSDLTTTGSILGTVTYLSPEQVLGHEPGPASDIYSVGVLLYELLAGRPPFEAETQLATAMAHTQQSPRPLREVTPRVPKTIEAVVARALEKHPDDRFSSADEMAAALRSRNGGESVTGVLPRAARPAARGTAARRTTPRRSPSPAWLASLVAAVVLAVVAAWWLSRTDGPPAAADGDGSGLRVLEPASARDFDPPPGGGAEHPDEVPLAIDGNPATAWSTETYDSPMHRLKPGVGLVVDLGEVEAVGAIRLRSSSEGYRAEIRAANEDADSLDDYEEVTEIDGAPADHEVDFEAPVNARYWLVWITRFPGDGSGSFELSEVELLGS